MRYMIPLIVFILSPALLSAEERGVELKAIEGTWKCVWFESAGKRTEKAESSARLVIEKDTWTWAGDWKSKIVLDSSTSPTVVDLEEKGALYEGICRSDGKTLTICLNIAPGAVRVRPTKFETTDGDGYQVIHFVRE